MAPDKDFCWRLLLGLSPLNEPHQIHQGVGLPLLPVFGVMLKPLPRSDNRLIIQWIFQIRVAVESIRDDVPIQIVFDQKRTAQTSSHPCKGSVHELGIENVPDSFVSNPAARPP